MNSIGVSDVVEGVSGAKRADAGASGYQRLQGVKVLRLDDLGRSELHMS
jgi:hypothetical protein